MKVQVHFFGNFRSIANRAEQTIELNEDATIREMLDYLIDQYTKMSGTLSHDRIKKSHVLIICGEKPVHNYNKKLREGDQLYLFIMLAGG
ncbi:MAG: MoaD/ThiS family protein [Spirochaetia bacterium]|jgi:molybdopterin converting factor small subunit|nr:MoaD/ThiS family protein [Spirochaetia bacterium]